MLHKLSKENHIFTFSKENKPAIFIQDGDKIEIETLDCFSNQIKNNNDTLEEMDWNKINPATGPIFINNAQKGDVLEISIKKIELADKGVVSTGKDLGVLGDLLNSSYYKIIHIKNGKAVFDSKTLIPIKPMIGVIGVAPESENINTGTPGPHGGNMDTKLIGENSKLYLPVFTEGALLALGDLHGIMGDGEVGVSGLEVAGSVTIKVKVIKNFKLLNPLVKTKNVTATIASDELLDNAVLRAVHDMADLFKNFTDLSYEEIATLFSLVGNAQISQVVDPLKTARFSMPNWILENYNIRF